MNMNININDDRYIATYNFFANYFENPNMVLLNKTNTYDLFYVRFPCSLISKYKYLIVSVPKTDMQVGRLQKLNTLKWVSLQFRILSDIFNVPVASYKIKKYAPYLQEIMVIEKTKEYYKYKLQSHFLLCTISLLIDKENPFYSEKGSFISSIETGKTVVILR